MATDEREELRLLVGVVGHRDTRAVLAGLPQRVVQRFHRDEETVHFLGVERLVETRRASEVPRVEEDVVRADRVEARRERLTAECLSFIG